MVSFAEAARTRSRAVIPDELTRAWDRPGESRRVAPSSADEWVAAARHAPPVRIASRSRILWVLAIILVAGAATVGVMTTRGGSSSPARTAAPQSYQASGFPFAVSFPVAPSVSHIRLQLMNVPYTATLYSATSGTTDVAVGVYPFPIGVPKMSGQAFLRIFASHPGSAPAEARLRSGRSATIQGLPALWLAASANGGASAGFSVLVLDGHVAYEILVTGPSTSVTTTLGQIVRTFRVLDPNRAILAF